MLTIRYSSQGSPFHDHLAESHVFERYLASTSRGGRSVEIHTSTENIVLAARVLVAEGDINRDNIRIIWNDIDMYIDNEGRFLNWQDSFSGYFDRSIGRLIEARRRRDSAVATTGTIGIPMRVRSRS